MTFTEINKNEFKEKMQKIAQIMGANLTKLDIDYRCAATVETGENGQGFWVAHDNFKNRLEIIGNNPRYLDGSCYSYGETVRITVSGEKTPEQIVNDINKRLMPEYKVAWEKAWARRCADLEYKNRTEGTIVKLAQEYGGSIANDKKGLSFWRDTHAVNANVTIRAFSDSLSMDLSNLNIEQVKKIMDFLKTN